MLRPSPQYPPPSDHGGTSAFHTATLGGACRSCVYVLPQFQLSIICMAINCGLLPPVTYRCQKSRPISCPCSNSNLWPNRIVSHVSHCLLLDHQTAWTLRQIRWPRQQCKKPFSPFDPNVIQSILLSIHISRWYIPNLFRTLIPVYLGSAGWPTAPWYGVGMYW